jgi:hypothetical protein
MHGRGIRIVRGYKANIWDVCEKGNVLYVYSGRHLLYFLPTLLTLLTLALPILAHKDTQALKYPQTRDSENMRTQAAVCQSDRTTMFTQTNNLCR